MANGDHEGGHGWTAWIAPSLAFGTAMIGLLRGKKPAEPLLIAAVTPAPNDIADLRTRLIALEERYAQSEVKFQHFVELMLSQDLQSRRETGERFDRLFELLHSLAPKSAS